MGVVDCNFACPNFDRYLITYPQDDVLFFITKYTNATFY